MAVEHYLVVRNLMYRSVYNHRLNVVCNWLLNQAIATARRLGPSQVWADPVMARWLWEPSDLDLASFLANDDIRTGYHLTRWMEEGPEELADPCGRLLERRLHKATAVSHLSHEERLAVLAEAGQLAEEVGFAAERSCGLQQRQSRGYDPYKGGIRLWDGQSLQALEQRSTLVQSLTHPVELAWLIHPAEVAPRLRRLLNS
jgi:HD superfamily phosphohydrolase